jgi:hypothetical protein
MTSTMTFGDGTSQHERLPPAMEEGYFHVDETPFEARLAMAARFGALLKPNVGEEGDAATWETFFERDESIIIASILSFDLRRAERDFLRFTGEWQSHLERLRADDQPLDTLPTLVLAKRLDEWIRKLGTLPSVAAMRTRERIIGLIEGGLAQELHLTLLFLRKFNRDAVHQHLGALLPVWRAVKPVTDGRGVPSEESDSAVIHRFLTTGFHAFRNAIAVLQSSSQELFQLALKRQNHDPAIGILLAFLSLFDRIRERANRFTRNHLHFYYGEVLMAPRRRHIPDTTCLILRPVAPGRVVPIARGAEFVAGNGGDRELIYRADHDLLLTDARVAELHTLFVERHPLMSPENGLTARDGEGTPCQFATTVRLKSLRTKADAAAPSGNARRDWPLFGDASRHPGEARGVAATLGFALASPVLWLEQGHRELTVTFRFDRVAPDAGIPAIIKRVAAMLGTTEADAYFKVFRHMFLISLTGPEGWFTVDEYLPLAQAVDPTCPADALRIQLRLPDGAPPVVAHDGQIHDGGFETRSPLIRFLFNPGAYLFPYDVLGQLFVREIIIDVEVRGNTALQAANQLGPLSTGAQFMPFGPLPVKGDYLVLGCREAAAKRLVAFDAEIEWGGLPAGLKEFADHYRGYPSVPSTDAFKVRMSALRDKTWIPKMAEQPVMPLFETAAREDGTPVVSRLRRLSFGALSQSLRRTEEGANAQDYGADARDGFLRLTLDGPGFAFGHRDYPLALARAMTENARRQSRLPKMLLAATPAMPLPNPPYTPVVNAISVNYKAQARFLPERASLAEKGGERLFHIRPLGVEPVSSDTHGKVTLTPGLDADGNLLIGIAATRPAGSLSLFFHLREDSLPEAATQTKPPVWHYLASNRWIPFDIRRILSDTTHGFLSSGIVTLDIPDDINRDNTILSSGFYWLRVSQNGRALHAYCSLHDVHAQALQVTWAKRESDDHSHLSEPLPAGSITAPRSAMHGVGEIHQIVDSSDGMPPEDERRWVTRVGERLKHKQRAVTPWDYERLVLENFPAICKVKCFPCMDGDEEAAAAVRPGHLLLVVVPFSERTNLRPMANARLLGEIRDFVAQVASGVTRIHVRNPAYEPIQVCCKVRFRKSAALGSHVRQLNTDIIDFLSPRDGENLDARFGWSIRCNDMEARIRDLEYVESVSALSLLHVAEIPGRRFLLDDTARHPFGEAEVKPVYPWSIAIPFATHLIEPADETAVAPVPGGVGTLTIGSSFILSKAQHDQT